MTSELSSHTSLKLYGSRMAEIARLFDDVRVTCACHVMRAVSSAMAIGIVCNGDII